MLIDQLISLVLALIMFSIGASLSTDDMRKVFEHPKRLSIGLTLQMIGLPSLMLVCMLFAPIPNIWKVGFMLVSFCPGGATSNFISYLLLADVALSVALTIVNTVLIVFTIPLFTSWTLAFFLGSSQSIDLPVWNIFSNMMRFVILPFIVGLWAHYRFPYQTTKWKDKLKYINAILLALVFTYKFLGNPDSGGTGITQQEYVVLLGIALPIQIVSFFLSYFIAKMRRLTKKTSLTIAIEVGLQNTSLALLLAAVLLDSAEMSKPIIVFASFSFFTTILGAFIIDRYIST